MQVVGVMAVVVVVRGVPVIKTVTVAVPMPVPVNVNVIVTMPMAVVMVMRHGARPLFLLCRNTPG